MRNIAINILLFVICCLGHHIQPTAARAKCPDYECIGGSKKRTNIDDLVKAIEVRADGEGPNTQEVRGGDSKKGRGRVGGGGSDSDGFQLSSEGDDQRSDFSDRRQLLAEKELLDSVNRRHPPSLEEKEEEEEEKEQEEQWQEDPGQPRRNNTNTDRRYSIRYTLTMLRKILNDIKRRINAQPVSDTSERETTLR